MWVLVSHKDKLNPVNCGKMNGTRGHYGKWNKPDTERQVLYVLACTWKLKKSWTAMTTRNWEGYEGVAGKREVRFDQCPLCACMEISLWTPLIYTVNTW
jgi:hypothetical protein